MTALRDQRNTKALTDADNLRNFRGRGRLHDSQSASVVQSPDVMLIARCMFYTAQQVAIANSFR